MKQIKADFSEVMGDQELPKQVKLNFVDVWSPKLLDYAEKQLQPKCNPVIKKMEEAIDTGFLEEVECKGWPSVKLAEMIFKAPNKKGMHHEEEAVLKVVTDTHESLDKVIETQIQPAIVMASDLYQTDVMYVVAEGAILVDIKSRKIADALVALLAMYYMYNVEQKVGKMCFAFWTWY
ncbi:Hypothetical predicted protein [Paramuricea clavata]|uniref:Uncharacterized protein n=1 Tax=Paramuricea clavata TaxID=317549 RepID=A0A6S7FGP0_PARCT|nr:Hypothetical predicted protein [Paramuricea clavata]